jgi:threonylcarbamoyladenosine tRNA methylthiotransferase MtaB
VRSLPLPEAVAEAQRLAAEGYREIVVTGIEISSWGSDLPGKPPLSDLVEAICRAVPTVRIRLGSLEPRTVTEEFCARLEALTNLCPQFHLSMQSGCDETLRRMRRKYDTARYFASVQLLRAHFDRPAITTDLIVGFPEETEDEFEETLSFMTRCAFAQMHVFPYSIRPGTPAAEMQQVKTAVKEARAHRAAALAEELHRAYLEGCVGQVFPVLFEQEKERMSLGHAPNYMEVRVPNTGLHNRVRQVHILRQEDGALFGELV